MDEENKKRIQQIYGNLKQEDFISGTGSFTGDYSLLPMAMKIAAKTVGQDLVSVRPIGGLSIDEIDRIANEVKQSNRQSKIDSLIEDSEYIEKKVEDHNDFKDMSGNNLMYLDFVYGAISPTQSSI